MLYVGLLTPRKGVLDLLEASRLLRDDGVAHDLWLLGGTPDEGPAAAVPVHAASRRATPASSAPDHPSRCPRRTPTADVFCLPSWWEAMPLSILEAMAAGLPVVASDVGDVSRAVAEGETGHVVPQQSPERLAKALKPLLTDPDLRRKMGDAGRARVEEHFSSAVTARNVSALYAEVQSTKASRQWQVHPGTVRPDVVRKEVSPREGAATVTVRATTRCRPTGLTARR